MGPDGLRAGRRRRPPELPDGVDGVIDLREDTVAALALSPAATAAGVTLETFGAALARDPDGFRGDLEGGTTLPANDKLAQLVRGFWSQGVRLVVPDGVRLAHPILVRWASGNPGRALITRTIVRLGAGADISLVEEQVPSGAEVECAAGETVPQGLFCGTTEVVLGTDARLAVAAIQDLGPRQVAFQHRFARIGEGASLRWAMAQLGSRLTRSRVDNRLEGDRSSVEQVEIVFGTDEQLFDLTSYTRHIGRDTTGNLLSKGALLDSARSYMKGLITIEKSAIGTDSFLGEFGMNLSKATRAVAIPSLEIDQPDCRRADALVIGGTDRPEPALLPRSRAGFRPSRPGSSSSSGSSSRSWRGSRSRLRRSASASCWRRSGRRAWRPGRMAPPGPPTARPPDPD